MTDTTLAALIETARIAYRETSPMPTNRERIIEHLLSKGHGFGVVTDYIDPIMRALHRDPEVAI